MLRRVIAFLTVMTVMSVMPAKAAISVYTDSSNFGSWADAVNSGNALGAADGVSAFIPNGGWIAFQMSPSFTVADFVLDIAGVTGANTALFYVGQSDGAGYFSALNNRMVTLSTGVNNLTSAVQSSYCVGLGGCDVFVLQAWNGTTISLDSAMGAITGSAPEPSAWALMIIGFLGLAWRMKVMRRREAGMAATRPVMCAPFA
jgi:PEP-CTERM motif-containing protein